MSGLSQLFSALDVSRYGVVLSVLAAWTAMALLAGLTVFAFRRAGAGRLAGALWGGGLTLAAVLLAVLRFDASTRDPDAERRAIEARATELTARAIAPGSALSCLDAVASDLVEAACERALFATSEAVAAAIAYVDARYSLLAASVALAQRDPSYRSTVERLRRGIEDDRFGVVAHVLSTRGCNTPDCVDLAILHDRRRILANMTGQTFATRVAAHATAWSPDGTAPSPTAVSKRTSSVMFSPAMTLSPPGITDGASAGPSMPATSGSPGQKRYDYPSADTIPAISIMDPELPSGSAGQPRTAPQRQPAARPQAAHGQAPAVTPRARPLPSAPTDQAKTAVPQTEGRTSGSR
jgi:hypothetical protein